MYAFIAIYFQNNMEFMRNNWTNFYDIINHFGDSFYFVW